MVRILKTRLSMAVSIILVLSVILLTGTGVSAAENVTGDVEDTVYEKTGETNIILDFPATPEASIQGDSKDVVSGLKSHTDAAQKPAKDEIKEMDGVTIQKSWWIKNAILVTADLDTVDPKELADIEGVERVELDSRVKVPEPVKAESDVEANQGDYTYGLEQINAPDVWNEMGITGEGVRVVVADSGVDADHPDIELTDEDGWTECVEPSQGSCVENNDPIDLDGHGTHVSGTVGGGDAGGAHIGVAPDVELAHARVLDDDGRGYFSDWIESMQWAVRTDSDIISMSMSGDGDKTGTLVEPVVNTMESGTLVVASIGNDGEGTSGSPGAVWDSMSSSATDENKDITSFSGGELIDTSSVWGNDANADWPEEYVTPDIAAPGSAVLSAEPGGGYQELWGTSMSAPHKTGTAALIISAAKSEGQELSPYEVKNLMMETAWKPEDWDESMAQDAIGDKDTRYGKGIIDAKSAVQEVRSLFEVSNLNPSDGNVLDVGNLEVSADVTNTGNITGNNTVELNVPGTGGVLDSKGVELGVGESKTVSFTVNLSSIPSGSYNHAIVTPDDNVTGSLTVQNKSGNFGTDRSGSTLDLFNVDDLFQGEDIEFDTPCGTFEGVDSENQGEVLEEDPIPTDQVTGTYSCGLFSPFVEVRQPRVSTVDLINPNGELVVEANEDTPLLLGIDYNYGDAELIDVELLDKNGVDLFNDIDERATFSELTSAQLTEATSYDARAVVEFNSSGSYELSVSPDGGGNVGDVDTATESEAVSISSDGDPTVEFEQDKATQGENVIFDITNTNTGDVFYVAMNASNRRYSGTSPIDIFELAGDVTEVGDVSTQYGDFYFAEIESEGTSSVGRIDTQYLDDMVVDLYLYSGGLSGIGNANFEEDDASLNVVRKPSETVATVRSEDIAIAETGNTRNSTVSVDAPEGLSAGDVTVSINTSVARITHLREGSDVDSGEGGVLFNITNRTNSSVTVEYTNIAGTGPVQGFKLAELEFELRSEGTDTAIGLNTDNFVYSNGTDEYERVIEDEGNITDSIFSDLLPIKEAVAPPQNIPLEEDGIDETLVEDIDGDGDPTDVTPAVEAFGELIRGNDLGLTDKQARKLNWNEDSPETEVTVADMVTLFGEKIRAD
jgi:subtilisin family serine protease